jgi:hypothetical protein
MFHVEGKLHNEYCVRRMELMSRCRMLLQKHFGMHVKRYIWSCIFVQYAMDAVTTTIDEGHLIYVTVEFISYGY